MRFVVTRALLGLTTAVMRRAVAACIPGGPRTRESRPRVRILIVRLDNLGDMILFSGFFRELRRVHPNAHVTLVASPAGAEAMAASPHINRIVVFKHAFPAFLRPFLMPLVSRRFAREQSLAGTFDVAIHPRWDIDNHYAAWLAYASRAPMRIAFSEGVMLRKAIFNRGLDRLFTHVLDDRNLEHESDRGAAILRLLGGEVHSGRTEVWPRERTTDRAADALLGAHARPNTPRRHLPLVAVSPAGGSALLKAWPLNRFAAVVRELVSRGAASVVLLGSASERVLADELARTAGVDLVNLVGETNLRETVSVLDQCGAFVGNDTGLLHVAVARGVPTVSLYGPSAASTYGPRGTEHLVIWSRLPCGPLPEGADHYRSRPGRLPTERCVTCMYARPLCLDNISIDTVVSATLHALGFAVVRTPATMAG